MTVYLVRHASAGARDNGDPEDQLRPLDPGGHLQAEKISDWLRHEPLARIITSPYLRCIQTIEPLAKQLGLDVEIDDRLAEGTDVEQSWELVRSVAGEATALCSHGDVIPDLIRRGQQRGLHIPGKSGCSKGSVWVLQHWDGESFATGVYTSVKV